MSQTWVARRKDDSREDVVRFAGANGPSRELLHEEVHG